VDADGTYGIEPGHPLTDAERVAIARWRRHLAAIVAYRVPDVRRQSK
jgi:hypothetical protein